MLQDVYTSVSADVAEGLDEATDNSPTSSVPTGQLIQSLLRNGLAQACSLDLESPEPHFDQSSPFLRAGGVGGLACRLRDKYLTAYVFIYLFLGAPQA